MRRRDVAIGPYATSGDVRFRAAIGDLADAKHARSGALSVTVNLSGSFGGSSGRLNQNILC